MTFAIIWPLCVRESWATFIWKLYVAQGLIQTSFSYILISDISLLKQHCRIFYGCLKSYQKIFWFTVIKQNVGLIILYFCINHIATGSQLLHPARFCLPKKCFITREGNFNLRTGGDSLASIVQSKDTFEGAELCLYP